MSVRVAQILGITGVEPHERVTALRWAQWLEWPILLVALWIPVQWYLEETGMVGLASAKYFDWVIWLVFVFETSLLTWLVRDKRRYLTNNWMNLVIIFAGMPLEWTYTPLIGAMRNLRLLLMLFLLLRLSRRLRQYLASGRIRSLMAIIGITTVMSGIIVSRIDPSIGSVWDGMWWAWVTLSHTGYGDVVPHSGAGRFFGALVILVGVVLISLFTANLSAYLIGGEVEKESRESDELLKEVLARLDRVEKLLAEQRVLQSEVSEKSVAAGETNPPG